MREETRACKFCAETFTTHKRNKIFCAPVCGERYKSKHRIRDRKGEYWRSAPTFQCQGCGSDFKPKRTDRTRFCSRECAFRTQPVWQEKRFKRIGLSRITIKNCVDCASKFVARNAVVRCHSCRHSKCVSCGVAYERTERYQRYCSDECGEEAKLASRREIRRKRRKAFGKHWRKRCRALGLPYENVSRSVVFERDRWRCQICGVATPKHLQGSSHDRAPTLDHRIPLSRGGPHLYSNVQCACRRCNTLKGNRIVVGQIPLFDNPQQYQ